METCSLDAASATATVCNRRQSSATIDNEVAMAVPMASSAKVVTFGGFKRRVASFHVAGAAPCDIPTCFIMCRKSFLCGKHNTFASFSEDELHFSWQAQHFGELHCHFACMAGAAFGEDLSRVECSFPLHFTHDTPDSTLYTLHSTLYILLHSLHFTLYSTLHP